MTDTTPSPTPVTIEVYLDTTEVTHATLFDADDDPIAHIRPTRDHARSFWQGLGVAPIEFTCASKEGGPSWRIYTERAGLRTGVRLSLSTSDEEAETWRAQEDHLWTVGTLGREHLPAPDLQADGDTRTLFFQLDSPSPNLRIVIDDHHGELWGTLESHPQRQTFTLRRWNGETLAELQLQDSDNTGLAWTISAADSDDDLDRAAVACVCVVAAVL